MAPGVLCVEKRTQGKGGLRAGREDVPERALFPDRENI